MCVSYVHRCMSRRACMYVCMYTADVCWICVNVDTDVCISLCVCILMCIHMHVCTLQMYNTSASVYTFMYVCMCVCVYVVTTYACIVFADVYYGVATMSRLLEIIGLFCRI